MKRTTWLALLPVAACGGAVPAEHAPPLPAAPDAAAVPVCTADAPYEPRPAFSGRPAALPPPPALPPRKVSAGDAFTVWGAAHHLHSRVHWSEVTGRKISIVGYIVKTNYDAAPACAVHRTGKGDPEGCNSPVPTFSIADDKAETKDAIDVMGWASTFAQLFTLIQGIDKVAKGKELEVKLRDEFWGIELPNPLPNVGAKVKVTGTYAATFTKSTGGALADPKHGILTVDRIEYLEPPSARVLLPGMKPKKR
jgi:hypothetical protein